MCALSKGAVLQVWKEEIFGPVLCVKTFRDEAEVSVTNLPCIFM